MLRITHTTPNRQAAHLGELLRAGEALLAQPDRDTPRAKVLWDVRVWPTRLFITTQGQLRRHLSRTDGPPQSWHTDPSELGSAFTPFWP